MKEVASLAADTAANVLCLCMMQRFAGQRLRPVRIAVAALAGALLAGGTRLARLTRAQTALCWLPVALVMAGIACRAGPVRRTLRNALLLMAAEGLLGGVLLALSGATGSLAAAWGLGFAAMAALGAASLRARSAGLDVTAARVTVTAGGRTATFEAMVDTGNCLRDYLTHRPVIVMPEETARRRLGLRGALRPIFADTAGGRQMMGCLTPQETVVEMGGRRRRVRAVLALSPGLSPHTPALLPQALLSGRDGEEIEGSNKEGDAYGKAES